MADGITTGTSPSLPGAAQFELLADNILEMFWILDPASYDVLYINPAFERITGMNAEEVYADAQAWRRLLQPDDRARVEEELDRHNSAGEPHNIEFRIIRPDDETRWVWARGLPVDDDEGNKLMVGVVEDITDRKRAEIKLEHSLSLLRATLQATADGILAVDRDGRITAFNDRFIEIWKVPDLAVTAGQEVALEDHILNQLDDPDAFRDRLEEIGQRPQEDSFDTIECVDGRTVEVYSRPRHLGDETDGRVWSYRDITARACAERALRDRTRRLGLHNRVLLDLARQPVAAEGDCDAALDRISETAAEMLDTERVGIWLYDSGHEHLRLIELFVRSEGRHESGDRMRRSDAPAYFAALEEERALAIHDVRSDSRAALLADFYCAPLGIVSMLDAPIRAAGEVVGVVCFEHTGKPRHWTVEDINFAGSIADLVSIVFESTDRERAEWGSTFLAECSAILASSLDCRTTIGNAVQMAIPRLADWCVVDLVENSDIQRVASRHADSGKEELLRELERRYPLDWDSPQPGARALRTGEPDLVEDPDRDTLASRTRDEEHLHLIEQLGARSYMAVPLKRADRILGAITFARTSRSFDGVDLALAQNLADRMAMAIDNSILYERAQESNRAKSNFLAIVGHELRTPLTAVLGYTELILSGTSGPINETQKEQLERIESRSQDLNAMITEILDYSRSDENGDQLTLETVDLAAVLSGVVDAARSKVEEAGLEFRAHVPDGPFPFETDTERLHQVLMILIGNAIRFTPEGSVELSAEFGDQVVSIRVADTGIGIDSQYHEQIFEPFFQVEDAMTREMGGTGLGLSIAMRSARQLGGVIRLDSAPGDGSTFTLELPAGGG